MRALVIYVRRTGFVLTLSAPMMATDAQVAIQVKSGTTWASIIERATPPVTFRWRWDGAETPTGVAWQVATVTPTSTATTRTQDVIAGETPMKLPASSDVKAGYEEFTVTPAAGWPATFYIRVRVNTGRTAVYSRWIAVSVAERAGDAVSLSCAVEGWHQPTGIFWEWDRPKPIVPRFYVMRPHDRAWIYALVKNTGRTVANYKRRIRISHDQQNIAEGKPAAPWSVIAGLADNTVRTISPGKTDTVTIGASANFENLLIGRGDWDVFFYVTPIDRPVFHCALQFTTVW